VQNPNQLNIFQCGAWNPSPTDHTLKHSASNITPNSPTTNTNQHTPVPTLKKTPTLPHSQTTKQPTKTNLNNQPLPKIPSNPTNYTHQSLKALALNTRGMHTTIRDLQKLLAAHSDPHIIALTETKHRHIN
jgi:hypothetical protein